MNVTDIELQALITEREGMLVANVQRAISGYDPAYGEKNFLNLSERIRGLNHIAAILEPYVKEKVEEERERCAKIAERHGDFDSTEKVCKQIARRIREGL